MATEITPESLQGLTQKGQDLLRRWIHAEQRIEQLRDELRSAEVVEANLKIELGNWLMPPDEIKEGERVGVWVNDGSREHFLQVSKDGRGNIQITIKPRQERQR